MTGPVQDDTAPLFAMLSGVAPALASYTQERIIDELWHRPGLSARDRSIVTVAVLVSRNATLGYPHYFNKALDCGLTPAELSELITHLAFYAGWPNAFGAAAALHNTFAQRGITQAELPLVRPELLTVETALPVGILTDEECPAISSSLAHFSREVLNGDLWRRPDLTLRDRALATVLSLAASGHSSALLPYLQLATDLGISRAEVDEALAHVAFYAGWGLAKQAAILLLQFDRLPA